MLGFFLLKRQIHDNWNKTTVTLIWNTELFHAWIETYQQIRIVFLSNLLLIINQVHFYYWPLPCTYMNLSFVWVKQREQQWTGLTRLLSSWASSSWSVCNIKTWRTRGEALELRKPTRWCLRSLEYFCIISFARSRKEINRQAFAG